MELTAYHFFDDKLNLYGDRGNILSLKYRSEKRGIPLNIVEVKNVNGVDLTKADIFFIGGGPDKLQTLCTDQLFTIKNEFKVAIEDGVSTLTICGGYQFLGEYYELPNGDKLAALNILDFYTKNPSEDPSKRLIGNLLVESDKFGHVVGFENHGGRTYHNYEAIGNVVVGYGNNEESKTEGLIYKNLLGTYLHGPILPKNPKISDWLIAKAIERKYGVTELEPLNDKLEEETNQQVWDLFHNK